MKHLGFRGDTADQIIIDLLRITIQDPDPRQVFDLRQSSQQLRQFLFSVEIHTIYRGFLSHQDQLPDAGLCQFPGRLQKTVHGNASIPPPELRDGAIGAFLITAFGYLQIFGIGTVCDLPGAFLRDPVHIRENGDPLLAGL